MSAVEQPREMLPGYRAELPPVPQRMRSLPISRGYPVPWFVAKVEGEYHFPTMDGAKLAEALHSRVCWVCGQKLGAYMSFVVGSLAVVNRTTSEPPCHHECAVFSARACPFLVRPHMKRTKNQAPGAVEPVGLHVERNPGVCMVWTTKLFKLLRVEGGVLFRLGPPTGVLWFCEGRAASRAEVLASIDAGMPVLREIAEREGDEAKRELADLYNAALKLVPA